MGNLYDEECSPSILVLYSSDNDSPDKVFPADPRLIQAHWESQNEKRQPPTPPASPASGVTTPSTNQMPEFWEMERSPTPSPTKDSPSPGIQDIVNDHQNQNNASNLAFDFSKLNIKIYESSTHSQIQQEVSSANECISKSRTVTFSDDLEFIEIASDDSELSHDEDPEENKQKKKKKKKSTRCCGCFSFLKPRKLMSRKEKYPTILPTSGKFTSPIYPSV